MSYYIISLASSALSIIGYFPEIYNLSISLIYKKPYNEYNSNVIWIIWLSSSFLGVAYSCFIDNYYVTANYATSAFLNSLVFILRYYVFSPSSSPNKKNEISDIENNVNEE